MLSSIIKERIRYAETDKMGVVYHSNYYLYMEIGRSDYIRKRGLNYSDIEAKGYYMFVTETNCKYFKPAKYEEIITVETILEKIKGAFLQFKYIISSTNGDVLAEGKTSHAFTNLTGKPKKIPEDIHKVLTKEI